MALWALPRCWVQLVGVSGGEKIYLGSSIIITIDPALSLAIGRQDGMDGGGGHWMTCSIIRTCHLSLGRFLRFGMGYHGGMGIILIELHIWDVFGYERGRNGAGERLQCIPEVQPSQLGNWCQFDLGLAVGHIAL